METTTLWTGILLAALGCWLFKVVGLSVPKQVLERPAVSRVANLIPVGLLAALVVVQVFAGDRELVLDARVLAAVYAVIALILRAPFLVVVFGAAGVAAAARLVS